MRGLGRESGHWGNFPKIFSDITGETTLTLDLPGFGDAREQVAGFTARSIVDALRPQMTPPFSILGISFGGMVALEWAHLYPQDLQRLVVINSSASNLNLPMDRMTPFAMRKLGTSAIQKNLEERETIILDTVTNALPDKTEWSKKFAELARTRPPSPQAVLQQLIAASLFRVHKISVPVLVLVSDQDRLCEAKCSEKLSEFLNAPLKRHLSAGHDLPLEDPAWVAQAIKEWMIG